MTVLQVSVLATLIFMLREKYGENESKWEDYIKYLPNYFTDISTMDEAAVAGSSLKKVWAERQQFNAQADAAGSGAHAGFRFLCICDIKLLGLESGLGHLSGG